MDDILPAAGSNMMTAGRLLTLPRVLALDKEAGTPYTAVHAERIVSTTHASSTQHQRCRKAAYTRTQRSERIAGITTMLSLIAAR
jgi:hypothetical protein